MFLWIRGLFSKLLPNFYLCFAQSCLTAFLSTGSIVQNVFAKSISVGHSRCSAEKVTTACVSVPESVYSGPPLLAPMEHGIFVSFFAGHTLSLKKKKSVFGMHVVNKALGQRFSGSIKWNQIS